MHLRKVQMHLINLERDPSSGGSAIDGGGVAIMDCGVRGSTIGAPGRGASRRPSLRLRGFGLLRPRRFSRPGLSLGRRRRRDRRLRPRDPRAFLRPRRNSSLATTIDVWALFFFHSSTKSLAGVPRPVARRRRRPAVLHVRRQDAPGL